MRVANKGIVAKPTNSVVMISLNLLTRFSDISGNLFLLNGIAKNNGLAFEPYYLKIRLEDGIIRTV